MASNHASRCGFPSSSLVRYTLLMKTSYAQKTLSLLRQEFSCLPDSRKTFSIPIKDAVMSALAMFSLKTPSLLKFDSEFRSSWGTENPKNLFGVMTTPSDTQMRTIMDNVPTDLLHRCFKILLDFVRLKKRLKNFVFLSPQKFARRPLYLMPQGFSRHQRLLVHPVLLNQKVVRMKDIIIKFWQRL